MDDAHFIAAWACATGFVLSYDDTTRKPFLLFTVDPDNTLEPKLQVTLIKLRLLRKKPRPWAARPVIWPTVRTHSA